MRLPWGGAERDHHGRYDILPITADMEWVPTSHGRVPANRRPVEGPSCPCVVFHPEWLTIKSEGGYEANGEHLWHAATTLAPEYGGVTLPGKTGTHLGGANFAFGGTELVVREGYQILCWR